MSKRTHDKELARARAKRNAERAEQQHTRRMVGAGIVGLVAIAAVVLGFVLQGDDDPAEVAGSEAPTDATATDDAAAPTPTPGDTSAPAAGATDASGDATEAQVAPPPMVIDPEAEYTATMSTEEGDIVIDLAAAEAPNTVNNFVALATVDFYDDVVFHRIQEGFVIQGGDPLGTGRGGPGYQFDDELSFAEQVVERNDGDYPRGTVAMANSGPDTNGSQFFIVDAEPGYAFPPNYAIFGMATEGLDVVDAIAAGETTGPNNDQAVDPVAITDVTIDGPVDTEALADFQPRAQ